MSEDTEIQTFSIPSWNLPTLEKKIKQINKKAAKLGVPLLEVIDHGTESHIHPNYVEAVEIGVHRAEEVPHYVTHKIEISGEGPKLAGWKFIGTLDHHTLPGSVIVNTVPGEHVPQQFYHNDAVCDHCGKVRRRIETFIVEHETGEHKQVGRQCIKDFLGHDPQGLLRLLSSIQLLLVSLSDEESEFCGFGGCGWIDYTFDHIKVLQVTSAIIRTHGWVPRSAVHESGGAATADDVRGYFLPPVRNSKAYEEWREWVKSIKWNDKVDTADAEGAMDWLYEQDDSVEYFHNLQNIAKAEAVPAKMFGYWCSLLATYQRAMERLRLKEKENAKKLNEWVGELKKRQEFTIEVISIRHIESYYGVVHLHRMLDDDGRTLVWFANTDSNMKSGQKYHIKGTVKKHDKYNDWKQTVLTRVAVVEEVE